MPAKRELKAARVKVARGNNSSRGDVTAGRLGLSGSHEDVAVGYETKHTFPSI